MLSRRLNCCSCSLLGELGALGTATLPVFAYLSCWISVCPIDLCTSLADMLLRVLLYYGPWPE